jgi:hypothetical protein
LRGWSATGEGPYSEQIGGKPGDLPTANQIRATAQSRRRQGATLNAAAPSRNGRTGRNVPDPVICAFALYTRPSRRATEYGIEKLDCGGLRWRPTRIRLRAAERLSCCGDHPRSESQYQASSQQRQHAPAQPHQRRTQMRGGGERHAQSTADREIGGYAHWTLRHQCKRDTGQRPACRAACAPCEPLLPACFNRRRGPPPAGADHGRPRIVASLHECAPPSWQQEDDAAGLSSY